ncbi:MAG: U32 family peptidase [Planctomycetes bacterium]|nr:U32 family peptidase [Planctomycetota bacterium]
MRNRTGKKPELLAPAGQWQALRAAAANGADAVYLGLGEFNARMRAENFAADDLGKAVEFLHARNVRCYVTLNTLIFSRELPRLQELIRQIVRAGADAVIVQDIGLVALIRNIAPDLSIHASTQMTLSDARSIAQMGKAGVSRAILPRELSIEQIGKIAAGTDVELEVFVHGAMCISYSGQCLASRSMFNRSGNRGQCAQVCRLPYTLVVDGEPADLGNRKYLLSPCDLAGYDRIGPLMKAGVGGFKIEGRLKSEHYVATATAFYRRAIGAAWAGKEFKFAPDELVRLTQSFSRGFTHGFLDGANHRELVGGLYPRRLGLPAGTVTAVSKKSVVVKLGKSPGESPIALKPGDGVVFDDGSMEQNQPGGRIYAARPYPAAGAARTKLAGQYIELEFAREMDLAAVAVGSTIWLTDDPAWRKEVEKSWSRDLPARRQALRLTVHANAGQPLKARLTDESGRAAEVCSDQPLEQARKHPLTVDILREQFGRLGDTPFELAGVELIGPAGKAESLPVMAPVSVLNALRRKAVEIFQGQTREAVDRQVSEADALAELRGRAAGRRAPEQDRPATPSLIALVRDAEQLSAVIDWAGAGEKSAPPAIWLDLGRGGDLASVVSTARTAGLFVGAACPRISKPGEDDLLEKIVEAGPDAVLVRGLGQIGFFRSTRPELPLVGDFSLNAVNELSVDYLAGLGLRRVAPGLDADLPELADLCSQVDPALLEAVIHLHVPLFHTGHCLAAANLKGGTDCDRCNRPCRTTRLALRDRLGEDHPILIDVAGRNTVYRSKPQSAGRNIGELIQAGVRNFRVELLLEDKAQTAALLDYYSGLLGGQKPPPPPKALRLIGWKASDEPNWPNQ